MESQDPQRGQNPSQGFDQNWSGGTQAGPSFADVPQQPFVAPSGYPMGPPGAPVQQDPMPAPIAASFPSQPPTAQSPGLNPYVTQPATNPFLVQQLSPHAAQPTSVQQPIPQRSRSFFRDVWFWIAVVTTAIAVALAVIHFFPGETLTPPTQSSTSQAPVNPPTGTDDPTAPTDTEYSDLPTTTASPGSWPNAVPPRDNSQAVAVDLPPGEHIVGQDIQPGRYVVSFQTGSPGPRGGVFLSVERSSGDDIADIFFTFRMETISNTYSAPTFTTDLVESDKILIEDDHEGLSFTPVGTSSSTTLTPGYWVVGVDIPVGLYTLTYNEDTDLGGVMAILTYTTSGYDRSSYSFGEPSVTATYQSLNIYLSEGQVLYLSAIDEWIFTPA